MLLCKNHREFLFQYRNSKYKIQQFRSDSGIKQATPTPISEPAEFFYLNLPLLNQVNQTSSNSTGKAFLNKASKICFVQRE